MRTFYTQATKSVIDVEKRTLSGVVGSTGVIDRHGESVNPNGWILDNYLENPVVLLGHDYRDPLKTVAKANRVYVENNSLMFDLEFADSELGRETLKLFDGGFLSAVSVGFLARKWAVSGKDPYTIMEQELLELSIVSVPANPEALARIREIAPAVCKAFEDEKTHQFTETEYQDHIKQIKEQAVEDYKGVQAAEAEKTKQETVAVLTAIRNVLRGNDKDIGLLLRNINAFLKGGDKNG